MSKMNTFAILLAAALILCTTNFLLRCSGYHPLTSFDRICRRRRGSYAGMADANNNDELLMESGSSSLSLRMLQVGSRKVCNSITRDQPACNR
ncbi:unnamed protein product [Linum trigynum]|uniref:Uncharacterized protein n=1 Tax=Linum trigynum TaxID=586398 RepID=A0AAV2FXP8_9ROSI